jgi:hypothetical protein
VKTNSSSAGADAEKQRLEQQRREDERAKRKEPSTTEQELYPSTTKDEAGYKKG